MRPRSPAPAFLALFALLCLSAVPARADEGMWTLDNLPLDALRTKYGFTPPGGWAQHLMEGCVSFGGGSGSFVSADGLVLTNHHVGLGQLQKMSTPEHDYVRDGFYARTLADERPCPDLELRVLTGYEDVTKRIQGAVDARATSEVQNAQRRAAIATLEKEQSDRTGLQCRVVELYRGGEYWLYRYRKYTDVRLVMAPEEHMAFYGGDPDNFSYPRHDLDYTFFRVYENGRPLHPPHWFRWSPTGTHEGDLTFVAGHPGSTSRQLTVAQLEYRRDVAAPARIRQQERRLEAIRAYAKTSPEAARQAVDRIRGLENNLKRERAFLEILQGPGMLEEKRREEADLRARVAADRALASEIGTAWDRVAAAQKELAQRRRENLYRDGGGAARLANLARQIVQYVAEVGKPNDQRFAEYRESNLESMRFQLLSRAPIYPALDEVQLRVQLEDARDQLGPDDPYVKAALGGREPAAVARELTANTQLADVAVRKALIEGGQAAVDASTDPLIVWARGIDAPLREIRKWREERVENVESLEGARIARARFALDGKTRYPDATGTLRVTFGAPAGYEQLGTRVPWKTTFHGLYDRASSFDGADPFELTTRVEDARPRVAMDTPLNFVSTHDIIGGNSGSPVLDKDLSLVGLVFDGNAQAFRWLYDYDDAQGRTVCVDARGIIESLRHVYGMDTLVQELIGPPR